MDNYINNISIPDQREIENEFGMHDYDSYDYAYLMVNYIIDYYGKEKLLEVLQNKEELEIIKKDLLTKAIDYYKKEVI